MTNVFADRASETPEIPAFLKERNAIEAHPSQGSRLLANVALFVAAAIAIFGYLQTFNFLTPVAGALADHYQHILVSCGSIAGIYAFHRLMGIGPVIEGMIAGSIFHFWRITLSDDMFSPLSRIGICVLLVGTTVLAICHTLRFGNVKDATRIRRTGLAFHGIAVVATFLTTIFANPV